MSETTGGNGGMSANILDALADLERGVTALEQTSRRGR